MTTDPLPTEAELARLEELHNECCALLDDETSALIAGCREALRLRAEVERLREATRWRPIAEAPRETLLGYCSALGVNLMWWERGQWVIDGFGEEQGWQPTHWMPLPQPPEPEVTPEVERDA